MGKLATRPAKAAVNVPASNKKPASAPSIVQASICHSFTLQDIQIRAYQKWEAAGKPAGNGVKFWLEAEEELVRTAMAMGKR